jgi:hypothetical protein
MPPETGMVSPVIQRVSLDARKAALDSPPRPWKWLSIEQVSSRCGVTPDQGVAVFNERHQCPPPHRRERPIRRAAQAVDA